VTQGYNGCIMAYGQTGTGKTHTILGKRDGLLPRSLEYIFQKNGLANERYVVDISCLQIYMENLTDLFDYKKKGIQIREKNGTFMVTNSIWVRLNNYDEAIKVIEETENRRKSCSTNMNQFSSRSHAIFIIKVTNIKHMTSSNLFLVDLAGSERIKKSFAQGDRLEEAISINTSLMALSKCIYNISENKWNHIPYRESKLTKILQETLAGNGKTTIIITISPEGVDIEETLSSLKFGQRASKIYCTPRLCKIESTAAVEEIMGTSQGNLFFHEDQKKILEEENYNLREQCKKLLRIVETSNQKSSKERNGALSPANGPTFGGVAGGVVGVGAGVMGLDESECMEITKDLKSMLERDPHEEPPVSRAEYQRLLEENKALKVRIDQVELEAFDSMRLTYEEIENNLYNEINEHKQVNKKQTKTIASLTRKLEEVMRDLEMKKSELEEKTTEIMEMKRNESRKSVKSASFINRVESHDIIASVDMPSVIGHPEHAILQTNIQKVFDEFASNTNADMDELRSQIIQVVSNKRKQKNYNSIPKDKENILSNSASNFDLNLLRNSAKKPALPVPPQKEQPPTPVLTSQTSQTSTRTIPLKVHSENSPIKQLNEEDQYRSATDSQKLEASFKITKVLEGLISDIDRKCGNLSMATLREVEALESVIDKFCNSFTSFVNHHSFKEIVDSSQGNKMSILKVSINIIVDNFIRRMVALRFAEKKNNLLKSQNAFLKSIMFSESIREQCFEVIKNKYLTNKAAKCIQKAFKKYKWRKAYSNSQRTFGAFDWGRVRAAMGKENIQMLLQEVENVFDNIQKTLA